jgi:hypothetical protein
LADTELRRGSARNEPSLDQLEERGKSSGFCCSACAQEGTFGLCTGFTRFEGLAFGQNNCLGESQLSSF